MFIVGDAVGIIVGDKVGWDVMIGGSQNITISSIAARSSKYIIEYVSKGVVDL